MAKPSFAAKVGAAFSAFAAAGGSPAPSQTPSVAPAAPAPPRRGRMMRVVHGAYRGAEMSRLTGDSIARTQSPVEQLRGDLRILRARGRDLGLNDALATKFLGVKRAEVLGSRGARLQAQVRRPDGELDVETNRAIEAAWKDWTEGPVTVDGMQNFALYEHLSFGTMMSEGEFFTRRILGLSRPHGLALQGIDPDMVDETRTVLSGVAGGNEIWLGVEVDGEGARVAYHVFDGPYSQGFYARPRRRIAASEIVHSFVAQRLNQARGVTWFAPIMVPSLHLNGYLEAVVVGSRAGASQMAFIEQDVDANSNTSPDAEGGADGDPLGAQPVEMETSPGTVLRLAPGEKMSAFTPTQPTDLFDDFTTAVERWIATGLLTSYSSLTGDYSKANYSSERASQLVQRVLCRMIQEHWAFVFRRPIYEWWLEAAILSGALRLPSFDWRRYRSHRWLMQTSEWVDPVKELEASVIELQLGLTTITQLLAERGEDTEEMLRQRQKDEELFKRYGLDLGALIAQAGSGNSPAADAAAGAAAANSEKQSASARIRGEVAAALNGHSH